MTSILSSIQSLIANVGPFFLLLGLLIFVHELGHFLVAKYFGIRVETFSLGFGKKILQYKKGDTVYCLSMIPLGGYVKMFGDDPSAEVDPEQRKYAFLHKPVLQRIAVVLAGPLMNLFFAAVIFIFVAGWGEEQPAPMAGDIASETKAFEMGFRSGDTIRRIGSTETPTWNEVRKTIEAAGGRALTFQVERKSEPQPLEIQASVIFGENENIFSSTRQVGQIPGLVQESRSTVIGVPDPTSSAAAAGMQSLDMIATIDGKKISYWRDVQGALQEALAKNPNSIAIGVRPIEAADKPDSVKNLEVQVKPGFKEGTDLAAWLGFESSELYIYQVKKDTPAGRAGVQAKDKVLRIDGTAMNSWSDVLAKVKAFSGENMAFTLLRDGKETELKIAPEMTTLMTHKGQEEKRFTIGIQSGYFPIGAEAVFHRITNPVEMVKAGLKDTVTWTEFVVMSLVRLATGDVSAKNIGGVITIGRVASHSFAAGISTFLKTMAVISLNLFLLNLLPVPILDGGHLVFYTYEGLRGTPLSLRKMEIAQQIGLMLLMFLMVFAFYNDIANLLGTRW